MTRARTLIVCYHAISDDWTHTLAVRPADFERQIRSILLRRYRPAGAAEAVEGRGRLVHVTFDDAFRSIEQALPVLERLGVPATVFACPGFADTGRPFSVPELATEAEAFPDELATMDWDALRSVVERGGEVGSHTSSHPHLTRLADAELARELSESRERIADELGRPCRYLAYPYGEHDARVRRAAQAAGYEAAFVLAEPDTPVDLYALPRIDLYRRDDLVRAVLKTSALRRALLRRVERLSAPRRRPQTNETMSGRNEEAP